MRSSADRKGDDLQQKSNGDWSITLPLFILRSHANTTRESNARILAQTSRLAMTRFLLPTNRSSFYFHLSTSPSLTCATQHSCFLSGLNNNILLGTMYSSTPMYSVLEQKKEKGKMENGKWKMENKIFDRPWGSSVFVPYVWSSVLQAALRRGWILHAFTAEQIHKDKVRKRKKKKEKIVAMTENSRRRTRIGSEQRR